MSSNKRKRQEEHENSKRWLLTYSDMITLLMAFFIMMYSMSVLNLQKFHEVAISIRSGFGGVLTGSGTHLLNTPDGHHLKPVGPFPGKDVSTVTISRKMNNFVISNHLQKQIEVRNEERGLVISMITDNLLFERGSAELTPVANSILTEIAQSLKSAPNDVMVEGHTCTIPIDTPQFPSNWELSAARASRVVRYLETSHVPGWRMSAVGYGETRPYAPNDTEEHRMKNRRVDIVVLTSTSEEDAHRIDSDQLNNSPRSSVHRFKVPIPKVWP